MYSRFETIDCIQSYVETAVSEIAYEPYAKDEFPTLFAKAKRLGVRDVCGWVADELYNDVDMVKDLVGDAFYEWCSGKSADERKEGATELGRMLPQCPGLADWLLEVMPK